MRRQQWLRGRVFQSACNDVVNLAPAANADPEELAEDVFNTLTDNAYAEVDDLIPMLAPHLGKSGLAHLRARMKGWAEEAPERPAEEDRPVTGYGSSGPIYADDIDRHRREMATRHSLQQIAAEIGTRLVAAGRGEEALAYLDAAETKRATWLPVEWEQARADALGRQN